MTSVIRSVPPLPATERGTFTKFAIDAPGERVIYCNSNNVIWRSLAPIIEGKATEKPEDIFTYDSHAKKTTCVQMSPNLQWVASGDETGSVKVWGAKGDHIQKNEYKLWAGTVTDVQWSGDSTRIMAAGDGAQTKAVAMIWDTGSKTGELTGQAKKVNSISFRSQRPFRVMTGSEDFTSIFYQGPPFKFLKSDSSHTNFVNWVGFSPDGEWAASAASDSKVVLFNGKEGELIKEFEKPAGITGSLWAGAWSPDSNRIVTAGGDKKLRIWDRESGKQVGEALVGKGALDDMQVGVCWPKANQVISICLDGRILSWDVSDAGVPTIAATVDGTQGALTCVGRDEKTGILVAGSSDGTVQILPPDQSAKKLSPGKQVQHVICHSSADIGPGEAWVVTLDNKVRRVGLAVGEFIGEPVDVKEFVTGANWFDAEESKVLCGSSKGAMHCVTDKGVEWSRPDLTQRSPTAFTCHPGSKAAFAIDKPDTMVNGVPSQEYNIHLFNIAGVTSPDAISEQAVCKGHTAEVSCLRFSPSGEYLASGDAAKVIRIWCMSGVQGSGGYSKGDAPELTAQLEFEYNAHSARVTALAWMPSGNVLLSGSLDQNVFVWDIDYEAKKVKVKEALKKDLKTTSCCRAHRGGVGAIVPCADSKFASVGADGFVLIHEIA